MRGSTKRNLLRVHWVFGIAWILVLGWMLALAGFAAGGHPETALPALRQMAVLNWVSLGLGLVILTFALAYGLWSWWGFGIRHDHWIVAQWVQVLMVFGVSLLVVRSSVAAGIALTSAGRRFVPGLLPLVLLAEMLVLVMVMIIAVRKPWRDRAGARHEPHTVDR